MGGDRIAMREQTYRHPAARFRQFLQILFEKAEDRLRTREQSLGVVGETLERRQRGQAPEIINISWRAQRRLNARWDRFTARRKRPVIANVAIARELAGWCWSLAVLDDPAQPASAAKSR